MIAKRISDVICVAAFFVLIAMSVMSMMDEQRLSYATNTGFFCAVFCLIPMILRHAKLVTLPLAFVIMIEVAIFLHAYGVLLAQYDFIQTWDTVTHSISSITVALCVFYALMTIDHFDPKVNLTRKFMPLFIFLIMMTFATYWEVFELVVDELWDTNMQYSPWDSLRDLICDTFGALVVSVYAYIYLGRHNEQEFIDNLEIHSSLVKIANSAE